VADYSISFARSPRKELERLPANIDRRILKKIEGLRAIHGRSAASSFTGSATYGEYAWAPIAGFIRLMTFSSPLPFL